MKCLLCGTEFNSPKKHGYQKKFCSKQCSTFRQPKTPAQKEIVSKILIEKWKTIPVEIKKQQIKKRLLTQKQKRKFLKETANFDSLPPSLKRERILDEQKNRCLHCNNLEEWNNKILKFELDHINGDRRDNSRQNLRLLCPNCHAQTETFCRNTRKISDLEIVLMFNITTNINEICRKVGIMNSGHAYNRIKKLMYENGIIP